MHLTNVFVLIAVAFAGLVSAQVPIPNRPDGYGVGGPADSHVVVEMFLDPLCPDCKATWPIILQVSQFYGKRIHFRIHTFPLPYHTNSFVASQGLHVIANVTNRNVDTIFQYATKIFEVQDKWYNAATTNLTMPQVVDSLADFVAQAGFTTKDQFLAGIASPDINFETRVSWKYACSRGAVGTPTFLINGVAVSADDSWSVADWKSVIDPILASNGDISVSNATCKAGEKVCEYLPGKTQCCTPGENCIPNAGCRCLNSENGNRCSSSPVQDCPAGQKVCEYAPHKTQCCTPGENCIANVGCRCLNSENGNRCSSSPVQDCPAGQKACNYLPGKTQCCTPGENCIANVGCRCFNLKNGNKCF